MANVLDETRTDKRDRLQLASLEIARQGHFGPVTKVSGEKVADQLEANRHLWTGLQLYSISQSNDDPLSIEERCNGESVYCMMYINAVPGSEPLLREVLKDIGANLDEHGPGQCYDSPPSFFIEWL